MNKEKSVSNNAQETQKSNNAQIARRAGFPEDTQLSGEVPGEWIAALKEFGANFKAAQKRAEELGRNCIKLDVNLTGIEINVEGIRERINGLSEEMRVSRVRYSKISEGKLREEERVATLKEFEANVNKLKANFEAVRKRIEELEADKVKWVAALKEFEANSEAAQEGIVKLEGNCIKWKANFDKLGTNFEAVLKGINRLSEGMRLSRVRFNKISEGKLLEKERIAALKEFEEFKANFDKLDTNISEVKLPEWCM